MITSGDETIILHEQANQGLTILEKFEKHINVGYVIVLLTPDDIGRNKSGKHMQLSRIMISREEP